MRRSTALGLLMCIVACGEAPAAVTGRAPPATSPVAIGLRLDDVVVEERPETIILRNEQVELEFDRDTGRWMSLRVPGVPESLTTGDETTIGARLGGKPIWGEGMAERRRTEYVPLADRSGVTVRFTYSSDWAGRRPPERYELTCEYTLGPRRGAVRRSAVFARVAPAGEEAEGAKFDGFTFTVPAVAIGRPSDCLLYAPGPFWPNRWIRHGTPYDEWGNRSAGLHGAPDAGFGILAVSNPKLGVTLASWMETGGEAGYQTTLRGGNGIVSFVHANQRQYRLAPRMAVRSDVHHVEVVRGGLSEALAAHRAMAERTMPLPATRPAWADEAVILEVYPKYFPDGFKGITRRLPFYKEVGFNTIYLMPHWLGGYSPIDLFKVDPAYGTEADLKELVATAHKLGLRVLFDMVIHGVNEKSPLHVQRPELFAKDEKGELMRHPAWKSVTFDWASPAYRTYMTDLVLHDLRTYGIDGYRVDAQSFKGPSWWPGLPYPAYRPGSSSHEVIGAMLAAMRKEKPDVIMLSEVFGPLFYGTCDLVHDNQTEGPAYFLEQYEAGKATAADYRNHMADVYDALPERALRVFFARNHDTSWFYRFKGYTPRFLALDAAHALFGVPEVFAGDPKHGPSPDEDPKVWERYRKLFALRRAYPELARGRVDLRSVGCDSPDVIAGLRRREGRAVLGVVSLSDRAVRVKLTVPKDLGWTKVALRDLAGGGTREVPVEAGVLTLDLRPFEVLAGR